MAQGLGGAASSEAHRRHRLELDQASPEDLPFAPSEAQALPSAAIGTCVHRALESIDLEAPADEALEQQVHKLEGYLTPLVDEAVLPAAVSEATAILSDFWSGELGALLRGLRGDVVARELDFVAAPDLIESSQALSYLTGAIDLVYRDPQAGGRWVVADFKTDRVDSEDAISMRAASYRGQLYAYASALRSGLGLSEQPRMELWFLRAGRRVELS
jgi:ATP-dependent exoDNAse (exonuclease V) beta subunit